MKETLTAPDGVLLIPSRSPSDGVLRRFGKRTFPLVKAITKTTPGKVGLSITAAFLVVGLFAPLLAPYGPKQISGPSFAPPSLSHLLGTDDIGEDLLSQLIWATRGSLLVAYGSGILGTGLGVLVGVFAGYYGGKREEVLMRATDVALVLPILPILIVIAAILTPSIGLIIAVISLLTWAPTARVIRSQTLSLRSRPFIETSRLSGMSDIEIIFKVILPNEVPLVIVYGVFTAVSAVVLEAGLDFIGLGSVNNLSWGIMLYFALTRNALLRGSWWWFLPPGLMIALLGSGLVLLGHAVDFSTHARER